MINQEIGYDLLVCIFYIAVFAGLIVVGCAMYEAIERYKERKELKKIRRYYDRR